MRFEKKGACSRLSAPIVVSFVALIILLALIVTVGWIWLGWWDITQNRRIIASLPLPPGAEREYIGSAGYSRDDSFLTPPENWSTRARFQVPGHSPRYLADFYISRLSSEWEYCMRTLVPGVWFVKANYVVSIDASNASLTTGAGSFDIHVRPDRGRNPCHK